ncbi:ATP-binding protein [bacterium]|nr:ATP-binding protein [bacterium]MCI0605977.1 ATP-binding protein [bacterium]
MEVEQKLCEFCSGTGWQIVLEGSVSRAKRCACARVISGDKMVDSAKVPPRYINCDFENYDSQSLGQERAKTMAQNFAADYPMIEEDYPEGGLLFSGNSGTGKTHLAVSVVKTLLKKGIRCLFVDFHDLLAEIRSSYDELSQTSELQILRPVLTSEVLVLDDLGSQRMTEWMQDTVFHIVNLRYQQKKMLLTTTNLAIEPAKSSAQESLRERLGYKVVSRLYEMCTFIELDGPDYRKEIRKASGDASRSRKESAN